MLFGDADPAGRLPVTFYKADETLPAFDDYRMDNRTYRYFKGTPLYAFGHGLSYARFTYSGLRLDREHVDRKGKLRATVKVKNSGTRAGEEVVQLYLRAVDAPHARANHELRGFQRVALRAGEERTLTFMIRRPPTCATTTSSAAITPLIQAGTRCRWAPPAPISGWREPLRYPDGNT